MQITHRVWTMGVRSNVRGTSTSRQTIYADDAQETNATDTVEELNGVLHVSNRFLDKELTSRGLGRNGDKAGQLAQFRDRGCQEDAGGTWAPSSGREYC